MKSASIVALACCSFSFACVNQLELQEPGDTAPVFVAEGDDLLDTFENNDGFHLTHVMAAHGAFSRIGLRFDAVGVVVVEARVSDDEGATFSDWMPSELAFEEGAAHNAFVDVPTAGASHLQLRFAAPVESQLTFLAVDAFDKDAEADVAEGAGGADEQALTSSIVRPRSAWGARSRNCTGGHTPSKITIHHTETPTQDSLSVEARLRQIQSYHIDVRGWCDIGYHFLVASDGSVWQGRPETTLGAHVAGANTGNVGISLIGNYMTSPPSAQMQGSVATMLGLLRDAYGITLNRSKVKGHREQGSTSCPGDQVQARLQQFIDAASSPQPEEPVEEPEPTEPPPSTCGEVKVVGAETLNVRPSASTQQSPVTQVHEGDVLRASGAVEGQAVNGTTVWYGVVVGSRSGYISGAYARCMATTTEPQQPQEPPASSGVYGGIDRGTASIPRVGLANDTLRNALGVATEPYGTIDTYEGNSYVRGRVSHFGGPNDTGVTSTETGAITGERLRSLNSPVNASSSTIAQRPNDFYYIAMRWDYTPHGVGFWRNARILVVNPQNGAKVVLRAVDWGPNTSTRRVLDISPQALKDLGARTDDNLLVSFAAEGAAVGVVR